MYPKVGNNLMSPFCHSLMLLVRSKAFENTKDWKMTFKKHFDIFNINILTGYKKHVSC